MRSQPITDAVNDNATLSAFRSIEPITRFVVAVPLLLWDLAWWLAIELLAAGEP